jgi:hypothetical protein
VRRNPSRESEVRISGGLSVLLVEGEHGSLVPDLEAEFAGRPPRHFFYVYGEVS